VGALDAIGAVAPESQAGYARLREVIDTDGALEARVKALLVAGAAAARGHDALTRREIELARSRGATADQIATIGAMLLLSRGEAVAERFMEAAGPLEPEGPPRPADERDAERYFRDYNQIEELPPRIAMLATGSPAAFDGYHRMHHAALSADPEAALLSELVCCTINAGELRGDFVAVHAKGARRAGATREQLLEALVCAMPVGGIAAWASSCEVLE
jgi:alkylhydroperoxidase/carboxymuconolactone decarboxylase family protein YurZ